MVCLLDTNTVSFLFRQHPEISRRLTKTPLAQVAISVITEAELQFGLARRPQATRLRRSVQEFLRHVQVLPWTHTEARVYGETRARLETQGITIDAHDLLIAVHAISLDAVLVSNDKCFTRIEKLRLEDWTLAGESSATGRFAPAN